MNQAPAKVKPKFPHHMIREIYEQPDAVRRVLKDHIDDRGTIRLPQLPFTSDQIRSFSKITIAASGDMIKKLMGAHVLKRPK